MDVCKKLSRSWTERCWGLQFFVVTRRENPSKTAPPHPDHYQIIPRFLNSFSIFVNKKKNLDYNLSSRELHVRCLPYLSALRATDLRRPRRTKQRPGHCAGNGGEVDWLPSGTSSLSTQACLPVSPAPFAFAIQLFTCISPTSILASSTFWPLSYFSLAFRPSS